MSFRRVDLFAFFSELTRACAALLVIPQFLRQPAVASPRRHGSSIALRFVRATIQAASSWSRRSLSCHPPCALAEPTAAAMAKRDDGGARLRQQRRLDERPTAADGMADLT